MSIGIHDELFLYFIHDDCEAEMKGLILWMAKLVFQIQSLLFNKMMWVAATNYQVHIVNDITEEYRNRPFISKKRTINMYRTPLGPIHGPLTSE